MRLQRGLVQAVAIRRRAEPTDSRLVWAKMRNALLTTLVIFWAATDVAATISRAAAMKELSLRPGFSEKELKGAYRKRSVETHPDKGGTTEAFLRVSEAYELLASPNGGHKASGGRGSAQAEDLSEAERMRRAEEMLDAVLEELGDLISGGVDGFVDELFGSASGPLVWVMKSLVKRGARAFGGVLTNLMESDGASITINGATMSGSEFKQWREQRKHAAALRRERNEREL